jgi:sugar phosphate isomerase/epimerase
VERAASIGCVIVIENIRDTNPNPLLELVASFKSESVRMSLDVGHANLMQAIGGPTPDAWVRTAGNLLGHVHLQDNDAMNDYHWPAGRGSINWQTLLLAIQDLETMQPDREERLVPPRLILEVREVEQAAQFLVGHGLAV